MDRIYDLSEYPFTIIENAILESKLSAREKLVLIVLKRFAGRRDHAWPGRKAIGRLASCSEATVKRVLKKLEEKDLLRIIRREGGTSVYILPGYEIREGELVPVWPGSPLEAIHMQHSGQDGNENPENQGNSIAGEKSGKIEVKSPDIPDLTKTSKKSRTEVGSGISKGSQGPGGGSKRAGGGSQRPGVGSQRPGVGSWRPPKNNNKNNNKNIINNIKNKKCAKTDDEVFKKDDVSKDGVFYFDSSKRETASKKNSSHRYSSEERVKVIKKWEETFGLRFPGDGDPSDRMVRAADYMIYLVNNGRLRKLWDPKAYLRKLSVVKIEPFPDYSTRERMVREAEERMRRLDEYLIRQVEARMREERERSRGPCESFLQGLFHKYVESRLNR